MKHCQRTKHRVPTVRSVKHVERGNFPMILYRIAKNLLRRDTVKIWCNSVLYILWGRKEKPTDGRHSLRWCGEHTLIYKGCAQYMGESTKLGYIRWRHSHGTHPPSLSHYGKPCISDMLGNFSINHVWRYLWF